jgi:hypothetical protein
MMACECPIAGYCARRGVTLTTPAWNMCRHGKLPEKPAVAATPVMPAPRNSSPKEKVGDALEKLIHWLTRLSPVGDCGCKSLKSQMNGWGAEGCEAQRAVIVQKMVSKRELLVKAIKEQSFVTGVLVSGFPDFVLKFGANRLLSRAIENAQKEPSAHQRKPRPERRSRHSLGVLSQQQKRLHQEFLRAPKPLPDPFVGEPVIHFGAHLWPVRGQWEKHVDRWNRVAETVNGKCLVGISECIKDCGTVPTAEVVARLSSRFEVFTVPNTAEGENPTFRELLKRIPRGPDDVFIYAHGKGMKDATQKSDAVREWTRIMTETVLFNSEQIVRKFAEGYRVFGSFRAFGKYPLTPKYSWHYAGTFFAVRMKHIPEDAKVTPGYGGVEAWPGNYVPANYAWVEFGDNRTIHSHYLPSVMLGPEMQASYLDWEKSRGPR